MVPPECVTTAFELPGFRVKCNLGVVRGIVVRSRSTRSEAFDLMIQHASDLGADAIIGARYDATEIMNGVTEVLAYGTAVTIERGGQ